MINPDYSSSVFIQTLSHNISDLVDVIRVKISEFINNFEFALINKGTSDLDNEKIYFIGASGISKCAWQDEGGKELFKERYSLETITIWERDEHGIPYNELHVYANELQDIYEEWEKKINNGEIPNKIRLDQHVVDNKLARFDGYIEDKMKRDPEFNQKIHEANVRYFNPAELEHTKVEFIDGQLRQIGLDSQDLEYKPLRAGEYAFVLGKDSEKPNQSALYMAIKEHTKFGQVQHSSFFRSGKVKSAGMFLVDEQGKIKTVVQYSGHYLPTQQETYAVVKYLRDHGCENFNVSLNKYTGFMLKATMALNTIAHRNGYEMELGMFSIAADEWIKKMAV